MHNSPGINDIFHRHFAHLEIRSNVFGSIDHFVHRKTTLDQKMSNFVSMFCVSPNLFSNVLKRT